MQSFAEMKEGAIVAFECIKQLKAKLELEAQNEESAISSLKDIGRNLEKIRDVMSNLPEKRGELTETLDK